MNQQFKVFATKNSIGLGENVADELGVTLGEYESETFSDGEVFVRFKESIRGNTIILIAQANMPYENLFELFLAVDAARRASAKEILVVMPYMPHSRQERKDMERTSIASRVVADFLQQSGCDRLITIDLHTSSIEGFFKIPVDHLDTSNLFANHINGLGLDNICLCSPDFGGLKRIKRYKKIMNVDMAVIHKERLIPNQVASMEIIGDVTGKNVIIVDDMIDTAGTLCKAAELIMEKGALSVQAYCTHALLSGPAVQRIEESPLRKVYVGDTVINGKESSCIEEISCAALIANAVKNLMENKSVKELSEIKAM
jgi:ribose-phosphate pyrophosphokinase